MRRMPVEPADGKLIHPPTPGESSIRSSGWIVEHLGLNVKTLKRHLPPGYLETGVNPRKRAIEPGSEVRSSPSVRMRTRGLPPPHPRPGTARRREHEADGWPGSLRSAARIANWARS